MMIGISMIIAITNITCWVIGKGVVPDTKFCKNSGMKRVRMSAKIILSITTIHNIENLVLMSVSLIFLFEFIFLF